MKRRVWRARPRAQTIARIDATLVDTTIDYLAYVGMMAVAVAIAVGGLVFAGQTSLHWVDAAMKPSFFEDGMRRNMVDEPMDARRHSLAAKQITTPATITVANTTLTR